MGPHNPPQTDAFSSVWLRGIAASLVDQMRALSTRVHVGDKRVVYAQGKEQACLWGIVQPEVRVQVALSEMKPTLGHIHHRGARFGESEPLLELPGIVEMRAAGDTVIEKVDYARFRRLAGRNPELWEALARLASMNQLLAMGAANDLALRTGRERLAAAILRLAGHRGVLQGAETTLELRVNHQDMTGLANLARLKVSEHLKALCEMSLIDLDYGCITMRDTAGLAALISKQT